MIDQYQVKEDKRSGIRSELNRADDDIVRLIAQVIHSAWKECGLSAPYHRRMLSEAIFGDNMAELRFSEAFAKYGAKLANPMWAFSAIAADGALVLSCWQHKFTMPEKDVLRYSDKLSRWQRENHLGKNLLIAHITQAYEQKLRVRLVIATTTEPTRVDAGDDASDLPKTFHLKEDFVGEVVSFDGDAFVIDFKKG